jgi:hypothetical protein
MYETALTPAIAPDRERSSEQSVCSGTCHVTTYFSDIAHKSGSGGGKTKAQSAGASLHQASLQLTHTGTDTFAEAMFVDPKTILKSHSIHGHYAGIRPVRLPNRKLAWPIAEIEKLFQPSGAVAVKEAA